MTKSEQARADAIADAETLRLAVAAEPLPIDQWDWRPYPELGALRCGITTDPGGLGLWHYRPEAHAEDARFQAHEAFRAVPALRGED